MSWSKVRETVEDRGVWRTTVHGVAKSWTQLSNLIRTTKSSAGCFSRGDITGFSRGSQGSELCPQSLTLCKTWANGECVTIWGFSLLATLPGLQGEQFWAASLPSSHVHPGLLWIGRLPDQRALVGRNEGTRACYRQPRLLKAPDITAGLGDFPGGPVVKTLRFHCRWHKFNPWPGK